MATGAPGTNGVYQYGEDDSEATFSALLNKVASTADTQIGTDRTRLTALEARPRTGLVPVVPSSVTVATGSGTVNSTTGLITLTAANTIKINSCFTDTFDNYVIQITGKSSAGAYATFRYLNTSGSDISTANYAYSAMYWDNANNNGPYYSASGQTSGYIGYLYSAADLSTFIEAKIANPYRAAVKPMVGQGNQGGTNFNMASYFNTTTQAGGFNFLPGAAVTFTGEIRIFGIRKAA